MELFVDVNVLHSYRKANLCVDRLGRAGIESYIDIEFRDEILDFVQDHICLDLVGSRSVRAIV